MIKWILFILSCFVFMNCGGSPPPQSKENYLSLKYAYSKNHSLNENTSIPDHNKIQSTISHYRQVYNDALSLYKGKKYLDSVRRFEDALKIHTEADTYYGYGKSLMSIGKFQNAVKAFEISDILGYENKINLYYNLACAYSLLNEIEPSIKYLRLSISKGFRFFHILNNDSNLAFVRKDPRWKQILFHITSDKLLTKNPKDFLVHQNKKIKIISNSKTFIHGSNEEDSANVELVLFEGLAFYTEEATDPDGFHSIVSRDGKYKIAKNSIIIELNKEKKETNHPSQNLETESALSNVHPISFELIYKDNLNGFIRSDFVLYGDDHLYALDRKICAYVKDKEINDNCEDCKKQYEQKGYFCAY